MAGESASEGGGGAGSEDDKDAAGSALSLTWGVEAGLELCFSDLLWCPLELLFFSWLCDPVCASPLLPLSFLCPDPDPDLTGLALSFLTGLAGLLVLMAWAVGAVGEGAAGSVQGWCGATVLPLLGVGPGKGSSENFLGLGKPSGSTRILAGPWVPLNA